MSDLLSTAVVTGAGSGVGQAVVLKLAAAGWRVALLGRRPDSLAETIAQAGPSAAGRLTAIPIDIGDRAAVTAALSAFLAKHGRVDALVNAAATNVPRRSLEELSPENFEAILSTNLHGAYHCIQALLPAMRQQRAGTIVNINSDAGLKANAKAGAAYVASKFGLAGLAQTINAEERSRGIRACSIFPGDINTPLLEKRPQPPPREARQAMLQPSDVAECVWLALTLPPRAIVEELLVRPA